jgi:hypothetical protein
MTARPRATGNPLWSKRWGVAAALSVGICVLWFVYVNWDGCWLYLRGVRGLVVLVLPCLWLLLLFGFRMKGRVVLLTLTLLGLIIWPPTEVVHVAAAEVSAVGRLRELRSALESHKAKDRESGYPDTLPTVGSAYPLQRLYRFEYAPSFSSTGTIVAYLIKATPARRSCGCTTSFTIADDGRLYYTRQERGATVSDPLLQ